MQARRLSGRPQIARGRSSTLRRAGESVSEPTPSTPPGALSTSLSSLAPGTDGAGPTSQGTREQPLLATCEASVPQYEEPCGLTAASLKHLRRQRDSLSEEKTRLLNELKAAQAQVKEANERAEVSEVEAREAKEHSAALEEEVSQISKEVETQRSRADAAERLNLQMKQCLAEKESEIERLQQALKDQRLLTKEVCETIEKNKGAQTSQDELEKLRQQKETLKEQLAAKATEIDDMRRHVAGAMAAAEKAVAMHACHLQKFEQLRLAKLADAINQKVELHISVPRVTLSYNNAPPLFVSAATGLADKHVTNFLNKEVFPHFEPLWVRLDSLDKAPDGSTKRDYATRMLDKLTEAVKGFIQQAQSAESALGQECSLSTVGSGGTTGATKNAAHGSSGAAAGGNNSSNKFGDSGSASRTTTSDSKKMPAPTGTKSGAAASSPTGNLSDGERDRLLELLRNGDDRGLDSKLCQLLSRAS